MKFTTPSSVAVALVLAVPMLAFAQTTSISDIPSLFTFVLDIINSIVVPLVFAVAFVAFLVGIYIYFIQNGANPEKRQEGTRFLMWSLIGFFIMFSVWGLINLFLGTLGFNNSSQPTIPTFNSTGSNSLGDFGGLFGGTGNTGGLLPNGNPASNGGCPVGYSLSNGQCVGNSGSTNGGQYCSDGTTSTSGQSCVSCPGIGTTASSLTCSTDQQNAGLNSAGQTSSGGCPAGYTNNGGQCISNGGTGNTVGGQYCSDGTTSASGTQCITCPGIGTTADDTTCATDQQNAGLSSNGNSLSNGGCPDGYSLSNGQCVGNSGSTNGGQYCSDGTTSASGQSCIQCAGIGTTANAQSCSTDQQNAGLDSNGNPVSSGGSNGS